MLNKKTILAGSALIALLAFTGQSCGTKTEETTETTSEVTVAETNKEETTNTEVVVEKTSDEEMNKKTSVNTETKEEAAVESYAFSSSYEYTHDGWDLETLRELGMEGNISLTIIESPKNNNLAYFSTREYTQAVTTIRVYQYNSETKILDEIFNKKYSESDNIVKGITEPIYPNLLILGYTSTKTEGATLVGLIQGSDDSSGKCAQPLLLADADGMWKGKRQLVSLSLSKPTKLEPFELPEHVRNEYEQKGRECIQTLEY